VHWRELTQSVNQMYLNQATRPIAHAHKQPNMTGRQTDRRYTGAESTLPFVVDMLILF